MIHEKILNFLAGSSSFSGHVSQLLTSLVQALLKKNPEETLKHLLLELNERIENILQLSGSTIYNDHKGDQELTWCLTLFSELLCARGDSLIPYKSIIISIFHRCICLIHKRSYEALAKAARHLLKSLSYVYPIEYRLTLENIEEPFTDFLPIRVRL